MKLAEQLLAEGVDVNAKGSGGKTPLHAAINAGDQQLYSKLLSLGANPNICDGQGASVVHFAAEQQDVFWLHEALKHGGNPNLPNTGNRHSPNCTPIFYAIYKRHTQTVLALIAAGADVNHQNQHGTRPLKAAYENLLFEVIINLIEAGADPRLGDNNGETILDSGWWNQPETDVIKFEDTIEGDENKHWYRKMKALLIEKSYLNEDRTEKK